MVINLKKLLLLIMLNFIFVSFSVKANDLVLIEGAKSGILIEAYTREILYEKNKDEKLSLWMQPIYDNLDFLLKNEKKASQSTRRQIEEMKNARKLELEALTYIRGRSIPQQFLIVDEAQNLTPHEVKTIVSRAGEGTKVVLTGDPNQIDNAYLDSSSNGLSYAAERLKTLPIHGHITLQKSERSPLASAAAEYL